MLDECSNTNQVKLQRDNEQVASVNLASIRMNLSLDSSSGIESSGSSANQFVHSQLASVIEDRINQTANGLNSARGYNDLESSYTNLHQHQQQQQQQQQLSSDEQYLTSDETNSSNQNLDITTPQLVSSQLAHLKTELANQVSTATTDRPAAGTTFGPTTSMVPTTAHCSGQQMIHYSLSNSKSITAPSPSNMALNFSHDLLQHHTNHSHSQSVLQHHHSSSSVATTTTTTTTDNGDHKPSQLELDSGSLMQTAAGMSMWKNNLNLNFKHDHSFLPTTADMNSFSGWAAPGGNLNHQPTSNMTQHILEQGQHLIGYPQHNQRSLHLTNHDLGATLKNHTEQASFMLNSINHQQAPISSHHTPHQSNDNSHHNHHHHHNHRNQSLDHGGVAAASYNLSVNDGHNFYSNRSQSSGNKSSLFLQDRTVGPVTLNSHHSNQLTSYHNSDHHSNPQPTTSHHHVSGGSGSSSSKNIGTFRCSHCSEIFNQRNLYQSHLKTHSQDKGSKAKFHCELCGHCFSQKTSLNRHMKSHTGERPFPCEVCGKAFSEKERLKIHMRTHTGEKPFSCGICGKSFSQKSTVKRHQTVHTGEKKFKCDCGKGFANRGNLIAHIKTRGANHFE